MARISKQGQVVIVILLIFCGCTYQIQNTLPLAKNTKQTLYLKGRIAIKNKQTNFLGAVEIYSNPEQFLLTAKDAFFRPVLRLSLNQEKITITKNGKTKELPNNKETKQKILGLDLNSAEFYAILWGKKTAKTKNLIFSLVDEPKFILKKSTNNTISINYLAWGKSVANLATKLPIKIKINSQNPLLEIIVVVKKHQMLTNYQG